MNETQKAIAGAFLTLIANLVICLIGFGLASNYYTTTLFTVGIVAIGGISLIQLIYVIPTALVLKRRQQFSYVKGVTIGAAITVLLNGGCWLVLGLN